jgi:hypothetical protein
LVGVSWHLTTTELGLVKIKSALDRIILNKKLVYFLILTKNIPETEVVSSNPVHGEVYSIQHYMIKFVSDL